MWEKRSIITTQHVGKRSIITTDTHTHVIISGNPVLLTFWKEALNKEQGHMPPFGITFPPSTRRELIGEVDREVGPGQYLILVAKFAQTCRPNLQDSCYGLPKLVTFLYSRAHARKCFATRLPLEALKY